MQAIGPSMLIVATSLLALCQKSALNIASRGLHLPSNIRVVNNAKPTTKLAFPSTAQIDLKVLEIF